MGSGPSPFDQPVGRGRSGLASDGPSAAPASSVTVPIRLLHGKVVVIDPGHNGENFRHPAVINRKVFIGTGMKACNTTGTETNAGYSEAAFTFDVSLRLAALLRAAGATVVLTRTDNHGVGPCVDQRAAIGNRAHADAAISIHGDGAPASGYGFHVIVPRGIGSNDAIVAPSRRLGVLVRDAFRAGTGEALSTYTGKTTGAIVARDDLGGLNLSAVPMVFIECGNMRNAADARRMTTQVWRQRAAAALADGITRDLANDG
jgi:N-acetylmuramoyl-L-alanine amidase